MSNFLKGNYTIKDQVIDNESDESDDEYTNKALNSIGGSMVFVERKKMVWTGETDDDK